MLAPRRMARVAPILALAGLLAILAASPASQAGDLPTGGSRQPQPGSLITAQNVEEYARFLPAATISAVRLGLRIRTQPTQHIQWSEGYQKATEKYSPQVKLDSDGYIANYVAGLPFPFANANDSNAAIKIAYNWHLGPVLPDDFSLSPWSSNGYSVADRKTGRIEASNDFDDTCERFQFLRLSNRTEVEPLPVLGSNPEGYEWKAKCDDWTQVSTPSAGGGAGGSGSGDASIWFRFVEPRRPDEALTFDRLTRRVRRLVGGVTGSYYKPDETCRQCHQPYWAYALPKTESYTYRLLGRSAILACMNSTDEPAGIQTSGDSVRLTEEPFQLRTAYILEMRPRDGSNDRVLLFIDSETYLWLAAEFFEDNQLVATTFPLWHLRPAEQGGSLFTLAGSFYFPTAKPGFFRSAVPAHGPFRPTMNSGSISASIFAPQLLGR
jgi:hypothetical protein